ncbi:MAG: GNAT family protein [Candidatus Omnitrophica bacterium]|nr:GNAT family protein [Candidatus Omnitrophota bacterium]
MKLWKRDRFTGIKPLNGGAITGEKIRLREKKLSDVREDYDWQTDEELSELDAAPKLEMAFSVYLLDYSTRFRHKDHNHFPLAIETLDGKHIGNCTCYEINPRKAEAQVGIMIGDKNYWNKGYGADVLNTLVNYIYDTSSFNRLYLKTLEWNKRAQKCFAKCGFTFCGTLRRDSYKFLLMELKREDWEKRQGK